MQLNLIAIMAIMATCALVVIVIIVNIANVENKDNLEKEWQSSELFVTSIVVNVVMMTVILKQMHEYHTDSQIRIRPWIGRSGDKKITLQSSEILEIKICNLGPIPAMNIEMFTLKVTQDRQIKFDIDRDHNAFALSPKEEFGLSMDICDIEKTDSIIFDNKKVESAINRLKIKQGILNHFEKSKNGTDNSDHPMPPWFGCLIQYTDPTRKIKGAYLVLGDYDRKTGNIAAEILLTM